jgi:Fe-S cluster assembly iron-binding protein IscA
MEVVVTINISQATAKRVQDILDAANRKNLRVRGPVNPVRPKMSNILRMAVERGLPSTLQALVDLQPTLPEPKKRARSPKAAGIAGLRKPAGKKLAAEA